MGKRIEEKILFVDDEPRMLASILRQLSRIFNVTSARNAEQALEIFSEKGPIAVVVSDYKMPGMDGISLLENIQTISPDTIRLLLTGYADLNSAIRAINDGNIFRFLTKPCETDHLVKALTAAIKQYRLEKSEKELLGQTLTGSISILTDILGLLNPEAVGRSSRIRQTALKVAQEMQMEQTWSIETAASLSQLGLVLLSPEALEELYQGKVLEGEDKQLYDMHPSIASDLLKKMPRMDLISEIILLQQKQFDGSGPPFNRVVSGDGLPIEARILKAVLDLDLAEVQGRNTRDALKRMKERKGHYDPQVLESLTRVTTKTEEQPVMEVDLVDLTEVMVFEEDVVTTEGRLVIPKGQKVTRLLVHRLEQYESNIGLAKPLKVIIEN